MLDPSPPEQLWTVNNCLEVDRSKGCLFGYEETYGKFQQNNIYSGSMDKLIKNDMQNNPIIFAKKGSGMLRGFQLNEDVTAGDFSNIAREKSLLLVGAAENTIRLLPPLNTSKEEVDNAFDILNDIVLELKKT